MLTELSQATTSMPCSARKRASTPVPHPISRIRSPGRKLLLSSSQTGSRWTRPMVDEVNVASYCSAMVSNGDEYAGVWASDFMAGVKPPPRQRRPANQYADLPPYSAIPQSLRIQRQTFSVCARVQLRSEGVDQRARKSGASGGPECANPCPNWRSMVSHAPPAPPLERNTACLGSDM